MNPASDLRGRGRSDDPTLGINVISNLCRVLKGLFFVFILLCTVSIGSLGLSAWGADQLNQDGEQKIRISTAGSADRVRPGDRVIVAVIIDIDPGLHINADARQMKPIADFKPIATELKLEAAPAGVIGELPRYPRAHPVEFDFIDEPLMVFDGRVVIYLPLQTDDRLEAADLKLDLKLTYQACGDDFCLFPESISRTVTLPVAERGVEVNAIHEDIFAGYKAAQPDIDSKIVPFELFGWKFTIETTSWVGWVLMLLIAALGGLLLNVTPCVLPMIPIKIMSMAQATDNRGRLAALGLSTFAGVVVFWGILAVSIVFVSGFTAANQLFQYPAFTISVGIFIAAMAISMCGGFSLRLPQAIYRLNPRQKTLGGSFGIGILIAVLSTPCTAPFMGTAAAFAVTQSAAATLLTFAAIGVGMGLPYFLLALFPTLVHRIPVSGQAGDVVKQVLGLFMLAAAAYFIGVGLTVLTAKSPNLPGKWYWWPVMAICAAAGACLAIRGLKAAFRKSVRAVMAFAGLSVIALALWGGFQLTDKGPVSWIPYSERQLGEALSQNRVAVLVFTAEWCLNCKAIESSVFSNPLVIDLLGKPEVAAMKADITGNNPAGKAKLRELGHLTIPLAVVLTPDGRMVFKSDFYTAAQLGRAIERALRSIDNPSG